MHIYLVLLESLLALSEICVVKVGIIQYMTMEWIIIYIIILCLLWVCKKCKIDK